MTLTTHEDQFEGAGGLRIFYRVWQLPAVPRGVVVICPGFNAHSGHYHWVAGQLANRGLAVYAVDLRGRGRSEGERFYVDDIAEYVSDVRDMIGIAKTRQPNCPVVLLGHSAGGVVSCVYALDHQTELAGLVCESFAFQVPAPDVALSIIKGISHLAPHAGLLRLKNADFSRDSRWVETMNADPLIASEAQPTSTIAAMARADERLKKEFSRITLPLLILHGTEDRATRPSGSQLFYDSAGSTDKTLKLYTGHYHDLLNDLGKEAVIDDVADWIAARVGAGWAAAGSA